MLLSVEEHPILRTQQLVRDIHHTRFDVCGRVQDLASHVTGGSNDDEFVEDGYAGQRAGEPFLVVFAELRIDAFEERTDEGDLPGVAGERAFVCPV
jgi:hypothetical protein